MSAFTRIRRGWHLGYRSLRIVFRDKTLLLFPMIPFTIAVALIVSFVSIIGSDDLFWALFIIDSFKQIRNLAIGYILVAIVSVFFATGLVACTRITLEERDSKLNDGLIAAVRKIHWVVLWALLSWTIGAVLNLLDHIRFTSPWVRKIAKTNWSQMSFFLLPVVVMDNINLFSAIRRAIDRTSETWGKGAISQLGLVWFFFMMNIPTLALFAYGHSLEGPWPKSMTFVILAMLYFTIVIYQTASAVLSVVLYKYATDRTVVPGFKERWLKDAFVKPRVYVLADEPPGEGYVPVEEVPRPDGIEPVEEGGPEDEAPEADGSVEPSGMEAEADGEHEEWERNAEADETGHKPDDDRH